MSLDKIGAVLTSNLKIIDTETKSILITHI